MELMIQQLDNENTVEMRLKGELDVFNCVRLKSKIDEFFVGAKRTLIINLDRVTYLDSRGTGILIYGNTRSRRDVRRFYLLKVHGSVRQVLEMTKLIGYLKLIDSYDEIS